MMPDEPVERVVEGFIVPRRGPLFADELRWQADLALGRILVCLIAELGLAEAAEVFEVRFKGHFKALLKARKKRPDSLSESKKRRLLGLRLPRQRIASEFAGQPGWPATEAAIEKAIQRLRSAQRPKRKPQKKSKKFLASKPLKTKQ